jgi:hypothetical protein
MVKPTREQKAGELLSPARAHNAELTQENYEELGYRDSTTTWLSDTLTRSGKTSRFLYEYDFGDSWVHEIQFEKDVPAEPGSTYPRCQEGARACPPEDCGGIWSYPEFVEAVQNKDHERHEELLEWIGGSFDPEEFDPVKITR